MQRLCKNVYNSSLARLFNQVQQVNYRIKIRTIVELTRLIVKHTGPFRNYHVILLKGVEIPDLQQ